MKKIILFIFSFIFFISCASKTQDDVISSNKEDISHLLNQLIEKEKQINTLNKQLENCKKSHLSQ